MQWTIKHRQRISRNLIKHRTTTKYSSKGFRPKNKSTLSKKSSHLKKKINKSSPQTQLAQMPIYSLMLLSFLLRKCSWGRTLECLAMVFLLTKPSLSLAKRVLALNLISPHHSKSVHQPRMKLNRSRTKSINCQITSKQPVMMPLSLQGRSTVRSRLSPNH